MDSAINLKSLPVGLIRWVGDVEPQDKLSLALRSAGVGRWAYGSDGSVTLQVAFFSDVEWSEIDALLDKHQGSIVSGSDNANFVVRFPATSAVQGLADEDIVQWVDNGPAPRRPRDASNHKEPLSYLLYPYSGKNDGARDVTRVNALQTAVSGANGGGTRLAVFDGGVDPAHPDFTGRLTVDPAHSDPAEMHGTHVAGTMAGDGRNSQTQGGTANQYRGVATAAQIFSFNNDDSYFASHQVAIQTNNADLSQNSWGGHFTSEVCDTHNVYSVDSQNMDKIVTGEAWGRGIVVSVAASNFREGTSDLENETSPICNFAGPPDFINYTSLSDLGSAKNIVSVGATQKVETDRMAAFSSWGPTRDGRLKPDIVAPGENIMSTVPGGGYGLSSGTSMATPHISGIASLLIQRYRTVFNNDTPRPATVLAILIQTARDLQTDHVYYTPGPDFASGYGMADAQAAYNAIVAGRVVQGEIANGATNQLTIAVDADQPQLKVTLAWDDPAPALNSATQLVNNLDLELVAPDGTTTHLPWVLNPATPAAAATRGVDNLNNVEQVLVENPAAGNWTLRVMGTAVPTSPQRYSVISSHGGGGGGGGGGGDDHGDSCAAASAAAVGSTLNGVLAPNTDVDYFRFELSGSATVTAEADSQFDSFGILYDASCVEIARDDDGPDGDNNRNFRIERMLSAGTYFLQVSSFMGQSGGGYAVALNSSGGGGGGGGAVNEPRLDQAALPAPNPPNPSCPSGYFTVTIEDGPGSGVSNGQYGMELLLDAPGTRDLQGGLNFGGLIDVGQVGFAGANIANPAGENQRLNISLTGNPASGLNGYLPVRIKVSRQPAPNVLETVFETTANLSLAQAFEANVEVSPGYYVSTVAVEGFPNAAAGGDPEGQFFFSLTTNFVDRLGGGFQGGAVVGGYHATNPFGGVSGFAGFCISTPHSTSIKVFSAPTYGSNGARDLRLRLFGQNQNVIYTVPQN